MRALIAEDHATSQAILAASLTKASCEPVAMADDAPESGAIFAIPPAIPSG
jgi:hypothetical protein